MKWRLAPCRALPSRRITRELSATPQDGRAFSLLRKSSEARVRALVKATAGPGFQLRDVRTPVIRDDEVLIQVRRAGVCGTDVHIYDWDAWAQGRCHPPFTVGHEFAGEWRV